MALHNEFGTWGEEQACFYLLRNGYRLVDKNLKIGHLEVDLIMEDAGELVFVEVKTRSREWLHTAFEAVDAEKKRHVLNAARSYKAMNYVDAPFRFDIITIVGSRESYELTHYVDAFKPHVRHHYSQDELW